MKIEYIAALILVLTPVVGVALVLRYRWFLKMLREEEQAEFKRVKDELCVLAYSLLAVLDGLKQQGCNGEVTKAHASLEKYLNQKAHGQK